MCFIIVSDFSDSFSRYSGSREWHIADIFMQRIHGLLDAFDTGQRIMLNVTELVLIKTFVLISYLVIIPFAGFF